MPGWRGQNFLSLLYPMEIRSDFDVIIWERKGRRERRRKESRGEWEKKLLFLPRKAEKKLTPIFSLR